MIDVELWDIRPISDIFSLLSNFQKGFKILKINLPPDVFIFSKSLKLPLFKKLSSYLHNFGSFRMGFYKRTKLSIQRSNDEYIHTKNEPERIKIISTPVNSRCLYLKNNLKLPLSKKLCSYLHKVGCFRIVI